MLTIRSWYDSQRGWTVCSRAFMTNRRFRLTALIAALSLMQTTLCVPAAAQQPQQQERAAGRADSGEFRWVNPLKLTLPGTRHATFVSPSMQREVGYCIYLPPDYEHTERRYPVIYYLHGGRPGDETKSVKLVEHIHPLMADGTVQPMIYVFVNGGPISHYNLPDRKDAMGADVFIRELIPHIDATWRTIADRRGRGIEGFSQGGRGTTRLMFRYPELFSSAAPGGAGQATEKTISQSNGRENEQLVFQPGDNTWDLAHQYAARPKPNVNILIHVGTRDFNYQNNLEYMAFLDTLSIPYTRLIVSDAPHSAQEIYRQHAKTLLQFHERSLAHASPTNSP